MSVWRIWSVTGCCVINFQKSVQPLFFIAVLSSLYHAFSFMVFLDTHLFIVAWTYVFFFSFFFSCFYFSKLLDKGISTSAISGKYNM